MKPITIYIPRIKFYIQIIKTILHFKGYKWYAPWVRKEMNEVKNEKNRGDHADYNNSTFIRMR